MKAKRDFRELLEAQWGQNKFVCVGLDPDLAKIPFQNTLKPRWQRVQDFLVYIIDKTANFVLAYKPQVSFYESLGPYGWIVLKHLVNYIHVIVPNIPIILDAKRADIGNTNLGYVQMAFDWLGVDAITVSPYLGAEALEPFLKQPDKGIIVLCKTSNPGAGEFQDLLIDGEPLWKHVARRVVIWDQQYHNCALVVGATYPTELAEVRQIVGNMPILIPGIGTQGGEIESTVRAGMDSRRWGMIINVGRSALYASNKSDYPYAAQKEVERLNADINRCRMLGPVQPQLIAI